MLTNGSTLYCLQIWRRYALTAAVRFFFFFKFSLNERVSLSEQQSKRYLFLVTCNAQGLLSQNGGPADRRLYCISFRKHT
jgi:hypothetical protein